MRAVWKPKLEFKAVGTEISNPNVVINEDFLGTRVNIYTGRPGFSIIIREYMVGTKFGWYAVCTKTGDVHPPHIKKRRRKLGGKKRKRKPKKK